MRIDSHQHLWTEQLLDALAIRRHLPLVHRDDGLTVLHSAGELPYVIDVAAESPERRAELVHADGLDLAVIAISSPIGIEALPRAEAAPLVEAYLDGVQALPPEFAAWGPLVPDEATAADVDELLGRGCVGVSVPAGAFAGPERLDRIGHVLEHVARRGVPLFVHPGRAPGQAAPAVDLDEPLWWRPLTDYVSQMQAAWFAFAAAGRRDHPELRVVFAMLAGGAPLLTERLAARGGPALDLLDRNTFYETSSYGPAAIEMIAGRVGESQIVYGSDRPVIEPQTTGRDRLLQTNAGDLLGVVNRV